MTRSLARTVAPALLAAGLSAGAHAGATMPTTTVDLSGFQHGSVVNGMTLNGVTIGVDNFDAPTAHDLAVVFDSNARQTRDSDLEGYSGQDNRNWRKGNLKGTNVGNMIIIQEKNRGDQIVNGVHNQPDDEGTRPAGNLYFDFEQAVSSFGFDLIDVEGTREFTRGSGFFATFASGDEKFKVAFKDLIDPNEAVYDSTVAFGDRSANRIAPVSASMFGIDSFDSVTLNFGGSGAVANLTYTTAVPTPSAALGGLALVAGCLARRRRSAEA
jgi:hypothetical protein